MWNILEFDHFEVLMRSDGFPEELGRGAMGITYKALDRKLLSVVVVKAMQEEHFHSEVSRKQFLIEAQAMAKIRHPNVPSIYYLGESEQSCFYAMEYCQGPNLQQLVQAKGVLSPLEAFKIGAQVANALIAVSTMGLVHRDIKPANLLVTQASSRVTQIKLIDFGLARNFTIDRIKEKERFAGTPMFASPEQFDPQAPLDVRADIYSLGMVIWFLLTGEPAYKGKILDLMQAQAYEPLPWDRLENLEPSYRKVLSKALAKTPQERYATAEEFETAILEALGTQSQVPLEIETKSLNWGEKSTGVIGDFPYEILEEIADLPFGKRFLGRELSNDRRQALTLLHPQFGAHPGMLDVLQTIRRKTRRRTHPYLLKITAQSHFQERLMYALDTDLAEHQSLDKWCFEHRHAPLHVHLYMLSKIADAMDFAGELGLIYVATKMDYIWVKTSVEESSPYLEPLDPELIFEQSVDEASLLKRFFDLVVEMILLTDHEQRSEYLQSIEQLADRKKIAQFDSCRELLETIVQAFDVELPLSDYSFLEATEFHPETLDQAKTQPKDQFDLGALFNKDETLPGMGARMSSLWGEILIPSGRESKDLDVSKGKIPVRILTGIEGSSEKSDSSPFASRPDGIKKALNALEDSADWIHRKKSQVEAQLQVWDQAWNEKLNDLEKEQDELSQWRAELNRLRDRIRVIKQRQLDIAQEKFLHLNAVPSDADIEDDEGLLLDAELQRHEKTIEELEQKLNSFGGAFFQKAQKVQRHRESERLDQDAALELLKDESDRIEAKRYELEVLLRQYRESRRKRVLGWCTTGVVTLGASSMAAYYMKGRLHDLRDVPGERAWNLLEKEREKAFAEKNWQSLVHWWAITQRQSKEDDALAGFMQRDLDTFQSQIQSALSELEKNIKSEHLEDKARLLHDLKEIGSAGFSNQADPLMARIKIQEFVRAQNWADALTEFNQLTRRSGYENAQKVMPEMKLLFTQVLETLRNAAILPRANEVLIEVQSMLFAAKDELGASMVKEVELGLRVEVALAEHERVTVLQNLLEIGLIIRNDKAALTKWEKRLEPILLEATTTPSQLLIEHTLWAEIARVWKNPKALHVLANTYIRETARGDQRPLLPDSTRMAYLKMAIELGSVEAKEQLKQEDQISVSQRSFIQNANAWLSGEASVGGEVDLAKARASALKIFDQDLRKWMMLGLIAGAEAEKLTDRKSQIQKIQEAAGLFLTASSMGYSKAHLYAAKCYEALGENAIFLALLEAGADAGDAECTYNLGMQLLEKDENRSMHWLIRAASLGHSQSLEYCRKFEKLMRQAGFGADLDRLKL